MQKQIFPAGSRGRADHGWLKSFHSFSFASYYDPGRMGFGLLRVLNDDTVSGGNGFGKHPHSNMEIISIPLEGKMVHQDTTGTRKIIGTGEVQIMSAGSGLEHSEFNESKTDSLKFLQIWIIPKERNTPPRYDQKQFLAADRHNKWQIVVSPDEDDEALMINQDAWLSLADAEQATELTYELKKPGNGMFLFVLDGEYETEGDKLGKRDAIGLSGTGALTITTLSSGSLLMIEVPME